MNACYRAADILLPDFTTVDAKKWAVVACDQFTSEPEYWARAEKIVGDAPSTLRMVLPEVYLKETEQRIPKIQAAMREYEASILRCHEGSMIYTERTQCDGSIRRGIVMAIDLECYDYRRGASSLIRATEATVVERIPPRVAIRRDAVIEAPHVMLLIDDPHATVIEPLAKSRQGSVAYDTDLMLGGEHICGRFLSQEEIERVGVALDALISPEQIEERYGNATLAPLLFAVGDGNHSLASAKAAYEEIKEKLGAEDAASHPARYALVEIVNIHDPALQFEPIYRVMFGVDAEALLDELTRYASELKGSAAAQTVEYFYDGKSGTLTFAHPVRQLTVGTLQEFIDGYLQTHPMAEVDYIHGEESLKRLAEREDAIGFLFSGMAKSELFRTVMFDGALPRKTFSMGHAEEKRYYMECRKIART